MEIEALHKNQEETTQFLRVITNYSKETMKNTSLTIQNFQQELRKNKVKRVVDDGRDDSNTQNKKGKMAETSF